MTRSERIAKLQEVLRLCESLEREDGMNMSETKHAVINRIKVLEA